MKDPDARVRVVIRRDVLESLSANWGDLPQAHLDPLLSHRWFGAAARALHGHDELEVVTFESDSRLAAIAPLARTRRSGIRWLEIIGSAALYEPSDLLARDEAARARLCEFLVSRRRPLLLQRVPADGGLAAALRRSARGHGRLLIGASAPSLRVDISGGWDQFLAGRSTQLRSGLRRKRAILERTGPVAFDALRPSPAELPSVLEEAFDVEADGWKGAAGSALKHNDRLRRFVTEMAGRFAEQGNLRVCFLRAGGRAVAMSILVEYNRRLWEIKIGYRESAQRASPGRLLLWETLRDAFSRGIEAYEFLGSGDGQQPDWATSSRPLHNLVYYPYSASGLAAAGLDFLARIARRLRR